MESQCGEIQDDGSTEVWSRESDAALSFAIRVGCSPDSDSSGGIGVRGIYSCANVPSTVVEKTSPKMCQEDDTTR